VIPRALRRTFSAAVALRGCFPVCTIGVLKRTLLRGVKGSASSLSVVADSTSRSKGGARALRILGQNYFILPRATVSGSDITSSSGSPTAASARA
jgi:hypothetical protein